MPPYEIALVFKQMQRPEIVAALKRSAEAILNKGGIIRQIENLGTRNLPNKISVHGLVHRHGSFFSIYFDTAPNHIVDLKEEFGRDVDILRQHVFRREEPESYECTLHDEMLPPAYRKDVQEMVNISKLSQKTKFRYNSGLDYYPFQK